MLFFRWRNITLKSQQSNFLGKYRWIIVAQHFSSFCVLSKGNSVIFSIGHAQLIPCRKAICDSKFCNFDAVMFFHLENEDLFQEFIVCPKYGKIRAKEVKEIKEREKRWKLCCIICKCSNQCLIWQFLLVWYFFI